MGEDKIEFGSNWSSHFFILKITDLQKCMVPNPDTTLHFTS